MNNINLLKKYILQEGIPKLLILMNRNDCSERIILFKGMGMSFNEQLNVKLKKNGECEFYRVFNHAQIVNFDRENNARIKKHYSNIFDDDFFLRDIEVDWLEASNYLLNLIDLLLEHEKNIFDIMSKFKRKNIESKFVSKEILIEKILFVS
jgi:hypothetical protein